MINKIISSMKEGTFFIKIKRKVVLGVMYVIRKICFEKNQIDNNKIMFLTFQGNYNCNPKAIANEIIRRKLPYKLIWVVNKENLKNTIEYPKELTLVVKNSMKFYKEAAETKIFIDNANNFVYSKLKKKTGQIILQPWHGSMGFKKLDQSSVKNENWVKKAKELGEITDYCIVNSKFELDVFKNSYWPNTPMLKYGHPRNDVLFNKNNEFKKFNTKVKEMYNIDKKCKLALYAPTFRDNCDFESYNLDYQRLHDALVKRFGGEWKILVRFHFKLKYAKIPAKYLQNVINVTDYSDMQELLCAVDFGITDYSSWMCDYILTRRPGFLFTLDIEKYVDERGFYYPLETSPFPVCKSNQELCDKIINFDEKKYQNDIDKFLSDKECYEDGYASKRVVELIKDKLEGEKTNDNEKN